MDNRSRRSDAFPLERGVERATVASNVGRARKRIRDNVGDIEGYVRLLTNPELLFETEAWAIIAASNDFQEFPEETISFYEARRDAGQREIDRRCKVASISPGYRQMNDELHLQWISAANKALDQIDLVNLLTNDLGYELKSAGFNSTRMAAEWAGSCPNCGGTDRFRVWGGTRGVGWCRRCGYRWDVISAVRSTMPGCQGFYAAVGFLCRLAGIETPVVKFSSLDRTRSPHSEATRSGAEFRPVRGGARRRG